MRKPEIGRLQLERDRINLERERLSFEAQRRNQANPAALIATILSVAALLVSGIGAFFSAKQDEREYRLKAVTFMLEQGEKLYSRDSLQQHRNIAIIRLFPEDMKEIIVQAAAQSAPDTASRRVWSQVELQLEFQSILEHHKGKAGSPATLREAEQMLRRLGAKSTTRGPDYSYGLVSDSTEVTIWVHTYGKPSCYGVRFGSPGEGYAGSNRTYFEICK